MFWGHSRGPFGLFTDSPFSLVPGMFAPDNPAFYIAQTLTLKELRAAMHSAQARLGQAVDIIAFKDCFMCTLETAYELKDVATFLVASPGIVPIEGWPYEQMLASLAASNDPAVAARGIVDELNRHYADEANRHGLTEVPYRFCTPLLSGEPIRRCNRSPPR